jgi:catechol 2,3-dioxygenase-like lactoylglutathione lyase family enzyme
MQTQPNRLFPLIVTDRLAQVRAFYTETLGYKLSIDTPDYFQVQFGSAEAPELCFIEKKPEGPFAQTFGGGGVVVSIPTPNADQAHGAWSKKKVPMLSAPTDMPYGWRSFALKDPAGVVLDFFHVLPQSEQKDAKS